MNKALAALAISLRRVLQRIGSPRTTAASPRPGEPSPIATAAATLERMLKDVDSIEAVLPEHEHPMSAAARSLIAQSLAECRKPNVDTVKLAADMQRVSEIALALRARILLAPLDRKPGQMN
jgi:hypothetical protein